LRQYGFQNSNPLRGLRAARDRIFPAQAGGQGRGSWRCTNKTTRTLAFQVPEELFERVKAHLKATGLNQKEFVIGLIEKALQEAEAGKGQGTAGDAGAETPQEDAQGEPA